MTVRVLRRRGRWLLLGVVTALVAVVGLVLGTGLGRDPTVVPSALVQRQAPPLAGPTLDGKHLELRDYRGRSVLVNVWASWCAACRQEHPVLLRAARELRPRGLRVVGIDMKDSKAAARRFLRRLGGPYGPSVFDPKAVRAVRWGTFAVPETYLVNPQGTIVDKATGPVTQKWVRGHVVPRLGDSR